jgi:hypothetical protein
MLWHHNAAPDRQTGSIVLPAAIETDELVGYQLISPLVNTNLHRNTLAGR